MINIKEYILNKAKNEGNTLGNRLFGVYIGCIKVIEDGDTYPKATGPLNIHPEWVINLTEQEILQGLIKVELQRAYLHQAPANAKVYVYIDGIRYSLEDELNKIRFQDTTISNYYS